LCFAEEKHSRVVLRKCMWNLYPPGLHANRCFSTMSVGGGNVEPLEQTKHVANIRVEGSISVQEKSVIKRRMLHIVHFRAPVRILDLVHRIKRVWIRLKVKAQLLPIRE